MKVPQVSVTNAKQVLKTKTATEYSAQNQMYSGIRMLAALRIVGRNDEANDLYRNLSGEHFDAGAINALTLLMNYNGRFVSHAASIQFCEKVQALAKAN